MRNLKITIIGAGSTYSPELICGFFDRQDLMCVKEFALMDIDPERLSIVGGLIERIAGTFDAPPKVTLTDSLEAALTGADYVITQLRVGKLAARIKDERIPLKYGYIGQETTGPGGFAKAVRTIPVILNVAHTMEKVCPNATLINFTNPSGIITEAVSKYSSIKVVGLCNGPLTTYMRTIDEFGWKDKDVYFDYFGLNHLGFIKGIYVDGKDVTDEYFEKILSSERCDHMLGYKFNKRQALAMRVLPIGYLQYYFHEEEIFNKLSHQEKTRGETLLSVDRQLLEDYKNPNLKGRPDGLMQRGGAYYSEAAVALMNSIENGDNAVHTVCLPNNGVIKGLDDKAVVEIEARVNGENIKPLFIGDIPEPIRGLIQHVKAYESLTVKAAAEQNKELAFLALCSHPFIRSVNDAEKMFEEIVAAHPEYIHLK